MTTAFFLGCAFELDLCPLDIPARFAHGDATWANRHGDQRVMMLLEHDLILEKYLLFTPGPVNVAETLRAAICKEEICHRETDFDCLLESIENKLLRLFEIRNIAEYRAVVITGSGTAANESILSSVVGDKNILILSNGEFGERLYNISKIHNKNTFLLKFA